MHICPEDVVWKRLEKFDDRKVAKWFKEWLYDSHIKFDKELNFKITKYDPKTGYTFFETLFIGTTEIKSGNAYFQHIIYMIL
jgi:hypothetical protein